MKYDHDLDTLDNCVYEYIMKSWFLKELFYDMKFMIGLVLLVSYFSNYYDYNMFMVISVGILCSTKWTLGCRTSRK